MSLLCLGLSVQAQAAMTASGRKAVVDMDRNVVQLYRDGRSQLVSQINPYILITHNRLVLHLNGKTQAAPLMAQKYMSLEAFIHLPYGIYALYTLRSDQDEWDYRVQTLDKKISYLQAHMNMLGLADDKLAKAMTHLLRQTNSLLAVALKQQTLTKRDIQSYYKQIASDIRFAADEAAYTELNKLKLQLILWHKQMTETQWKKLVVVIGTSKMDRQGNLLFYFFQKAMRTQVGGWRIIVAENAFAPKEQQKIMGTYYLDSKIGQALFGDPKSLHGDIMAEPAKKYLNRMVFPF